MAWKLSAEQPFTSTSLSSGREPWNILVNTSLKSSVHQNGRAVFIKILPNKTEDKLMSLNFKHFWFLRIVSVGKESGVDDSEGDIMGNISGVPKPGDGAPPIYHLSCSHHSTCWRLCWRGSLLGVCQWLTVAASNGSRSEGCNRTPMFQQFWFLYWSVIR